MQFIVTIHPEKQKFPAEKNQSILDAVHQNIILTNYTLNSPCGGQGRCGNCRVRVMDGALSPVTDLEMRLLTGKEIDAGHRLACQAKILSHLDLEVHLQAAFEPFMGEKAQMPCEVKPLSGSAGVAIDLGTTKIGGYLVDLTTGKRLAAMGMLNPQVSFGADIISRLAFAGKGPAFHKQITSVLQNGVNRLVEELARSAALRPGDITEIVIAGNTAMHHLLLRLPIDRLSRAPYTPATTLSMKIKGRQLGLNMAPEGVVYFMPLVAAFVGSDHVAMMIGSRITESDAVTLGLDIGTNTEIVLSRDGHLMSCSCASGPAFEGAQIHQGMLAVDGAICRVKLYENGTRVTFETISGSSPRGICGSGIVDAVAEFYRHGIMSDHGILNRTHPGVRFNRERGMHEFLLVPQTVSATGSDLVITQKDISEIQLAKAAVAAGISCLLSAAGIGREDIEKVILTGAFGLHLNTASAIQIGMLPDLPMERFDQVANAAGAGASLVLFSAADRRRAEQLAAGIRYLELSEVPGFGSRFARALRFGTAGTCY
ncbi:MAG: ASKHA domain-containing protein [Desulfobacterales bacterium]|nr:ASKHA domain-containing protein [Desulfobacterales bacterium]